MRQDPGTMVDMDTTTHNARYAAEAARLRREAAAHAAHAVGLAASGQDFYAATMRAAAAAASAEADRWEARSRLCTTCGMVADVDSAFHAERYGHWPTA